MNGELQFTWHGEESRPFQLCRPCPCGCDNRDGVKGVGYLTGSDKNGNGFTIWIDNDEIFNLLKGLLKDGDNGN